MVVAVLGASGVAYAANQGHEVTVVNPYAGCVGVGADGTGVNYPNTEPEPWVARNPAHSDNFIGATQQDRWSDGGAKGLTAAFSTNDGHTWQDRALPFSQCAIPYYSPAPCPIQPAPAAPAPCTLPYDRASDAWVDVGPDGTAYSVSISFNANDPSSAVGAAVSLDGGNSWTRATEIQHDPGTGPTQPFNDKESVTADPRYPGTAYAVWDRLVTVACGPSGAGANRPRTEDRKWSGEKYLAPPGGGKAPTTKAGTGAALVPPCFEGPTYFSKTIDGGVTWSPPRPIVENAPDEQTIGNQIVVDPMTGRLYDTYAYFAADGTGTVEDVFSTDGGATWSPRQTANDLQSVGIHDPATGELARTGDVIPEPAIDPNTGQLYVAWQDARFNTNAQDDTVISTSPPQAGLTGTWSAPVRVNLPQDRAGFTPAIKVNALGQVGVDYYSLRHPINHPEVWPVERYLRITSGPAQFASGSPATAQFDFGQPTHVGGPFNLKAAPVSTGNGYFVGDYEGMAIDRHDKSFHTFFSQTNCDTTKCIAIGNPTGAPVDQKDPMDVFSSQFYKGG